MLLNQLIYTFLVVLMQSNNIIAADADTTVVDAAAAAAAAAIDTTTAAAAVAAIADTTTAAAAVAAAAADTTTTPVAAVAAADTTTTTPVAAVAAADTTTTTPIAAVAAADTTTTTPIAAVAAADTTTTNTLADAVDPTTTSSSSSTSTSTTAEAEETENPDLVSDKIIGTWSSKANTVFTGPGFYDPVDELLIEPALPGISYSFTEDGYWEEAIYQVSPNPRNHSCPAAIMIYQHGTYTMGTNGSLVLTPFKVDGRQLLSQPCSDGGVSIYSRYNQTEEFKGYQVYVDPYHGKWRLDLIKSNGEIMQPLYLAYQPPQMLPTITMNPTSGAGSTDSAKSKAKREENGLELGLAARVKRSLENQYKTNAVMRESINYSVWWWTSISMMVIGAVVFVMA